MDDKLTQQIEQVYALAKKSLATNSPCIADKVVVFLYEELEKSQRHATRLNAKVDVLETRLEILKRKFLVNKESK